MGYWDATDRYLSEHGGAPTCPNCGKTMFAADDHGRFKCFCTPGVLDTVTGFQSLPLPIPQVDVSGLDNDAKAKIPAPNRMAALPTEAEARLFALVARGPDVMDDPEYAEAVAAVEAERAGNPPSGE